MAVWKKIAAMALSILIVFPFFIMAKNRKHGADLEIYKKNGQIIRGELIAVKQDSLLLLGFESSRDITVNLMDIQMVKVSKKSNTGLGIGLGFLAGAIPGAIVGAASDDGYFGAGASALIVGGFFGLIGAIIGGVAGATAGSDKIIQIEGKIEYLYDRHEIIENLRKKARITDYK